MASQPEVLHSCIEEAAKAAKPALERCIEDAVAALELAQSQSASAAEREELMAACRALLEHKTNWSAQYRADLLAVFRTQAAEAAQATLTPAGVSPRSPGVASTSSRSSIEAFSLVEDADVSLAIESSRLLQLVLPAVEQSLAELNTLISAVQGLPNVRPELNPLRPEVFAQALQQMIFAAPVDRAVCTLWIKYLAAPLGRELKLVYERLINQLELANVQGAGYRVLQTPASGGSKSRGNPQTGTGQGAGRAEESFRPPPVGYVSDEPLRPSQFADLTDPGVKSDLFHDFLFNGASNAQRGLSPAYYDSIEEELKALKAARETGQAPLTESRAAPLSGYQKVPAVDRPQRVVDERSQLSQQVWGAYGRPRERDIVRTQLKKEARQVGQVMGLEVVRKLVSHVAQDPRLLAPVREAIVALEPSLMRLAMVDPLFFSDEDHPGRRLMERVAQRSFSYNDEFSTEFSEFLQPVIRAFNKLNGRDIQDAQPFDSALATLAQHWDEQDQFAAKNRDNLLQALRFAEERQTLADEIALELSRRSDLGDVPALVLDFLFESWALAMAHARLTDTRNQVDPEGFGSVVPDLLWSVKREVTLKRPAKLFEMLPGLLGKLHAGLALLGQDPRESETFFAELMKLHRPVLKLRRLKSQRDAEESGAMPLEPEEAPAPTVITDTSTEPRQARSAAPPWLGRDDLDAAGFEDTLPTAPGELAPLEDDASLSMAGPAASDEPTETSGAEPASAPEPLAPATGPAIAPTEAERLLRGLQAGHWVDLYSKHRWLRAQLIWAGTKGTLFMFVSHGGQPHSMTRRSCERLIRDRLLRPVDTQGVVGQALDALALEADASAGTPGDVSAPADLMSA